MLSRGVMVFRRTTFRPRARWRGTHGGKYRLSAMEEGMTQEQLTIHVGIDVTKDKLAAAITDGGLRDEVLSLSKCENTPASVDRQLK
jgi:hypothetical protein